jgi:hypothetical protein
MKSFFRVVVPIGIIMVVVGLASYLTQNTSRSKSTIDIAVDDPGTVTTQGQPLTFVVEEVPVEDRAPIEVEQGSKNHKDYWFYTSQPEDVKVGTLYTSCTCSKLQIGTFGLTQDEIDELERSPSLGLWCKAAASVSFQDLPDARMNQFAKVLASPAGHAPRPHILRVFFEAKPAGSEPGTSKLLSFRISASLERGTPSVYSQEFGYLVVPGAAIFPVNVDLGELTAGSAVQHEIIVWSVTREHLHPIPMLMASRGRNDNEPCAAFSEPTPLSPAELAELPRRLGPDFTKVKPKGAARFRLTLHERKGQHQLDVGPLNRQLIVKFDTGSEPPLSEVRANVTALVRGDVRVLSGDENGRIQLGSFRYDRGKTVLVRVGTTHQDVDLEVDSVSDDGIVVSSLSPPKHEGTNRVWELQVHVKPHAYLGEVRQTVFLRTKGPNSRRVRVPLIGNADR